MVIEWFITVILFSVPGLGIIPPDLPSYRQLKDCIEIRDEIAAIMKEKKIEGVVVCTHHETNETV